MLHQIQALSRCRYALEMCQGSLHLFVHGLLSVLLTVLGTVCPSQLLLVLSVAVTGSILPSSPQRMWLLLHIAAAVLSCHCY